MIDLQFRMFLFLFKIKADDGELFIKYLLGFLFSSRIIVKIEIEIEKLKGK